MIDVVCENPACRNTFQRLRGELKRSSKIGRKNFCSHSCSTIYNNKTPGRNIAYGHLNCGNRRSDLSPFRFHLRMIKMHCKERKTRVRSVTINAQDLKIQWDKQGGICPFTGWKLETPETTSPHHQLDRSPRRASVDRIDSSKGYHPDNIQFVSLIYQYAKNGWNHSDVVAFAKAIIPHGTP